MRSTLSLFFLIVYATGLFCQTPEEIIQKSEDLMKGESCKGSFTMTVVTPSMVSNTQKNHKTEMEISRIETNLKLSPGLFSFKELEHVQAIRYI